MYMYVHDSMVRFFGGIPKMLVLCNFLEILTVSDKTMELIQLYKQNPLEIFFNFHYLPKLYIGFKAL